MITMMIIIIIIIIIQLSPQPFGISVDRDISFRWSPLFFWPPGRTPPTRWKAATASPSWKKCERGTNLLAVAGRAISACR